MKHETRKTKIRTTFFFVVLLLLLLLLLLPKAKKRSASSYGFTQGARIAEPATVLMLARPESHNKKNPRISRRTFTCKIFVKI
jgi:hypothetical protein